MTIVLSVFISGYRGKTIDFAKAGFHHRTTISHFLNHGKWDSSRLEKVLKANVIRVIYQEAVLSGEPIFCIVDDTIASHAKPSSQAMHPIEAAYFHQSHLKGCQDYGHQAVSVMLSCNGITLNYAMILYDKSKSKIQIVQEIAGELPTAPVVSYFLCDSWYTSAKVMDSFIRKGFYTIGALKTNRIIYPCGIRQKVSEFALHLRKGDPDISLVTVDNRNFYVYRYEGKLNDVPNAVVILSYPERAVGDPKALRVFISTNAGLSTQKILDDYSRHWPIMSLVHYMCCTYNGTYCSFEEGYQHFQRKIREEQVTALYQSIHNGMSLEDVLKLVG